MYIHVIEHATRKPFTDVGFDIERERRGKEAPLLEETG